MLEIVGVINLDCTDRFCDQKRGCVCALLSKPRENKHGILKLVAENLRRCVENQPYQRPAQLRIFPGARIWFRSLKGCGKCLFWLSFKKWVKTSILKKRLIYPTGFPIFFHRSLLMMVSNPAPDWDASTKSMKFDRDNGITYQYQNLNLLIRSFGPFNYKRVGKFPSNFATSSVETIHLFWRSLRIHPGTSDHKHVENTLWWFSTPQACMWRQTSWGGTWRSRQRSVSRIRKIFVRKRHFSS